MKLSCSRILCCNELFESIDVRELPKFQSHAVDHQPREWFEQIVFDRHVVSIVNPRAIWHSFKQKLLVFDRQLGRVDRCKAPARQKRRLHIDAEVDTKCIGRCFDHKIVAVSTDDLHPFGDQREILGRSLKI